MPCGPPGRAGRLRQEGRKEFITPGKKHPARLKAGLLWSMVFTIGHCLQSNEIASSFRAVYYKDNSIKTQSPHG